jgi:AAA+ superfamily predicted ATPase
VRAKPGNHRRRPADTWELEKFVRAGETVFAVMEKPEDMPLFARPLSCQVFHLPPFNRAIAISFLRQTHSVTGQLAEDEGLRRLPSDADLADLPLATIASAFHADTTLKVADRLAELCAQTEEPTAPPQKSSLTLDSMALSPELEAQAAQILTDLNLWQNEKLDWQDVPSSLFLHGEPGNGKTFFAQALAGSADIPIVATSFAECQKVGHLGDYLNEMSGQVENAIKQAPCVFFLDEIDNFFTRSASDRNARYMHSVVNGLLEQLTKLNETAGVILIGAGNNRSGIDPAVLRSGRFDCHIEVKRPDHMGVQKLLRHLAGDVIQDDLAIEIADRMLGKSAADVTNLLRRAKSHARRAGEDFGASHLKSELNALAPARSDDMLHRIAIHEAGHAVVGFHLGKPLPERVQITTRGGEYHGTHELCYTIDTYKKQLTVLLAGRAAEAVILGAPSDGASDDLQHATALAFQAHGQWGLFDDNLIAQHADRLRLLDPNSGTGKKINEDISQAFQTAVEIIEASKDQLDRVATTLTRHRELNKDFLEELLGQAVVQKDNCIRQPIETGIGSNMPDTPRDLPDTKKKMVDGPNTPP